jgi:CHASE2 domain-containing sensor protein
MKYFWRRDTFISTVCIFLLMGLLSFLPLNTHFLDPIKLAFQDFDFNDLYYARFFKSNNKPQNNNIVIINVKDSNRNDLTQLLRIVKAQEPRVIGLDVYFEGKRNVEEDERLANEIKATPNLVVATNFTPELSQTEHSNFIDFASHYGYINLVGEDGGVIRSFVPFAQDSKKSSFTASVVKQFDEGVYQKLHNRNKEVEYIRYAHSPEQWIVFDGEMLLKEPEIIIPELKDKIVLLGYVNYSPDNIEDKHFTPLNEKFAGKSRPDMNGVFIHANIIHMILNGNFINKVPRWLNWALAFFIVWIHMAFFIKYYVDQHIWFHLAAKTAQVLSAILFIFVGLLSYSVFNLKLELTATLAGIILAVDVLYFYEALMVWLNKKYGTKSIFNGHQHH